MKKIIALSLILLNAFSLSARTLSTKELNAFSGYFKEMLDKNSYTGFLCYISPKERRIFACNDFNKQVYLGDSSNIITNTLAFKLEQQKKFDRNADIKSYAEIFNYNAGSPVSFADMISSKAAISRHLDKLYPKDAEDYEYFDFLLQLNPDLSPRATYEYSKISNLGAVYALAYSQTKKPKNFITSFKYLIETYLTPAFGSLKLEASGNYLDMSFSMNLRDFAEYLAREQEAFSAKQSKRASKGEFANAWLFTEHSGNDVAMVGGQHNDTYVIANFYDEDIIIAIYIDNKNDERARNFAAFILQDIVDLINK